MPNPNVPADVFLEGVLDEMLEGFQVVNRDWRYLYVNETVAKQGRSSREDLLGKTMMECYPGIEKTPLFKDLTRCMTERVSMKVQNEFIFPNGEKGWFELCINPVADGIIILSVDITARKKLENELKSKVDELNTMLHSVVDREKTMIDLKITVERLKQLTTKPR